mgnify:CR=1 FL=1
MDSGEALAAIEAVLQIQLLFPKSAIFRDAWDGLTYTEMLSHWSRQYDESYIRAQGAALCEELAIGLGGAVRKRTFREDILAGLERRARGGSVPRAEAIAAVEAATLQAAGTQRGKESPAALDSAVTRWVGRETLVAALVQQLQTECRVLMLVGLTGIGKTALAARLLVDLELQQHFPARYVVVLDHTLPNIEQLTQAVLGPTAIATPELQQAPAKLVATLLARLKAKPGLLVLDMAEEVLVPQPDGSHTFANPVFEQLLAAVVRANEMPSRILITSQVQPPLPLQGRYPARSRLQPLTGLTTAESLQLFAAWGVAPAFGSSAEALLHRIIRLYEGHPLALQVIAGELQAPPYHGNIDVYWSEFGPEFVQIEQQQTAVEGESPRDDSQLSCYRPQLQDMVRDRIELTFQRLRVAHPLAYRLLVMAAVYRRAVEPGAWYRLIDEYSSELIRPAFNSLERRYLIERERYQTQVLYRQHSLIRCVALKHLSQFSMEV